MAAGTPNRLVQVVAGSKIGVRPTITTPGNLAANGTISLSAEHVHPAQGVGRAIPWGWALVLRIEPRQGGCRPWRAWIAIVGGVCHPFEPSQRRGRRVWLAKNSNRHSRRGHAMETECQCAASRSSRGMRAEEWEPQGDPGERRSPSSAESQRAALVLGKAAQADTPLRRQHAHCLLSVVSGAER